MMRQINLSPLFGLAAFFCTTGNAHNTAALELGDLVVYQQTMKRFRAVLHVNHLYAALQSKLKFS
jgi:hypothetical protein